MGWASYHLLSVRFKPFFCAPLCRQGRLKFKPLQSVSSTVTHAFSACSCSGPSEAAVLKLPNAVTL